MSMNWNRETPLVSTKFEEKVAKVFSEDVVISDLIKSHIDNVSSDYIMIFKSSDIDIEHDKGSDKLKLAKATNIDAAKFSICFIHEQDYIRMEFSLERPKVITEYDDRIYRLVSKIVDNESAYSIVANNGESQEELMESSVLVGESILIANRSVIYDKDSVEISYKNEGEKVIEVLDMLDEIYPVFRKITKATKNQTKYIIDNMGEIRGDYLDRIYGNSQQYQEEGMVIDVFPSIDGLLISRDKIDGVFDIKISSSGLVNQALSRSDMYSIEDMSGKIYNTEYGNPICLDHSILLPWVVGDQNLHGWFSTVENFISQGSKLYFFKDDFNSTEEDMDIFIWSFFLNSDTDIFDDMDLSTPEHINSLRDQVIIGEVNRYENDDVAYLYKEMYYEVASERKGIIMAAPTQRIKDKDDKV